MRRLLPLATATALLLATTAEARTGDPVRAGRTAKAGKRTTTLQASVSKGSVLKLLVGNGKTKNPKVAPFTTNATGVATGLNADKVDGLDASQLKGAPGPQGPVGPQGPPGPIAGVAAGGVLAGTFPNPTFKLPLALATDSLTEPVLTATHANADGIGPALSGATASTVQDATGIYGEVTPTAPGGNSAGVYGHNKGTAGLGIGVRGEQDGSGYGVYGKAVNGYGVVGVGDTGVFATSPTGVALTATTQAADEPAIQATAYTSGATVDAQNSNPSGAAIRAVHIASGGTAVEVDGGITSGGNGPAWVHTVATGGGGNTCLSGAGTVLDDPQVNGRPTAMIQVTRNATANGGAPQVFAHQLSVIYSGAGLLTGCTNNRWVVFTEDNVSLPNGFKINVLAIHG